LAALLPVERPVSWSCRAVHPRPGVRRDPVSAAALTGGRALSTRLLHAADGGLLYVDEINLLPDHLVESSRDLASRGVTGSSVRALS